MPYSHSSIDEQVVKMMFDNSNFDQNINDSIQALNHLDNKLGLLNKEDFSGIEQGISKLANLFSVKGQVMFGVFASLGNEIVNLGLKIKNALTQGVRDGLGEYKLIIDSTQTIFQNVKQSGATLENVNDALDELNDYADKTIYNFAEMTRMIGMFTSAGVGLKKSVSTIKGLANAAALVGANSEKAQVAWHAVSRAMSSGVFSNITWKSLELSNIAGKQFNEVITQVARANKVVGKSGKNIDEMIKKYGSLRLTLSEGWLNKDIFAEAMQILAGDLDEIALKEKGYTESQIKQLTEIANSAEAAATQVKTFQQLIETTKEAIGSGWAQSFRIIIGDLEQAKKMFTRISIVINDFIDNNAKIRNKLFTQIIDDRGLDNIWKSGRENFQQTIENMMAVMKTFMKSVQTGFLNIFPIERISTAARKVLDIVQKATKALVLNKEQLGEDGELLGWDTEHIHMVSDAIKDLIRFFRGLASAVDIAWMAFSQPLRVIIERIPFLRNFFEDTNGSIVKLVNNLGKFGDRITVVRNAIKNTDIFAEFLRIILDNIDELGEMYPVLGSIFNAFRNLKSMVGKVKDAFDSLNIKPLSVLFGAFKLILTGVYTALDFVFNAVKKAKEKIDWSFLDGPKNAIIAFIKQLSDYGQGLITFKDLTEKIGDAFHRIFQKIASIFDKFKINKTYKVINVELEDSFSNLDHTINNTGNSITKIWDKIDGFFDPIKQFFINITNGSKLTFGDVAKRIAVIGGAVAASTVAISLLIKTIKKVKIIDNINDLLLSGIGILKAYQRQIQSKMILNIAIAIGILAASMAAMAFIPYDKLENGLVIFTTFMATLGLTLPPILTAMAKFNESLIYTRKQVKELTQLDVLNNLVKELGLFGREMADGFKMKMVGEMFKDLAMSIFIFVGAVSAMVLLFKYDMPNTVKALQALGMMLAAVTAALAILIAEIELLSKKRNLTNTTVDAFSSFFKLSGVARVILAISASIAVLIGAMALMTKLNPDRLKECWGMIMMLLALLGVISITITGISALMDDIGKFKKINVSLGGAILGIAALMLAMKPLMETIDNNVHSDTWIKALTMVTAVIAQFTAMGVVLMSASRILGGNEIAWVNLNKYVLSMTVCIAAIGGITALLGYVKPIDKSVVTTLITLTAAFGILASLLSVIAIVTSKSQGIFAGGFAVTITSIAISLASIVSSFGILAAGVAALVAAINAIELDDVDTKTISSTLIVKLTKLAVIIKEALPKLKEIFYNLGASVGSIATNFIKGFAESIIDAGDTFDDIAEDFVTLVLNILSKVVDILYRRKDDIVLIVKKLINVLSSVITAVVGSFFKKADGSALFTEQQVMGLIGAIGIASAVIKIITVLANVSKAIRGVSGTAAAATKANAFFSASLAEILLAIGAVAAAVVAVESAYHALRKSWGKDTEYINTDIQTLDDALTHLFSDKTFTMEVFSMGFEQLGLKIVSGLMSILKAIASGLAWIGEFFIGTIFKAVSVPIIGIAKLLKQIDPAHNDTYDRVIKAATDMSTTFERQAKGLFESGMEDFKFAWDWTDFNIDASIKQELYNDNKEAYSNAIKGAEDGWDDEELLKKTKDTAENVIGTQKETFDEHSPSKVTKEIYHNLMLGGIQGLNLGEKEMEAKIKELSEREKYLFEQGATKTAEAWKDILQSAGLDADAGEGIRSLYANVYDSRTNKKYEQVQLNREMVDLINSQAEALNGMNREQARNYLLDVMRAKGITADADAIEQMQFTLEAFYSNSVDSAKLHTDQIRKFAQGTMLSVLEVAGKSAAAEELVIKNTYDKYYDVWKLAEENKELLVGKKKEEVEEILKEEAKKAGLTAAEAEDTAKLVAGTMFAGLESQKEITKEGLEAQLKANELEYLNYEKMQYQKTRLLEKEYDIRNKLAEKQAWIQSKFDSGWTASEYQAWMRSSEGQAYQKLLNQHNSVVNEYKNTVKQQQDNIKKLYTDAGMSSENAARRWQADYDKALSLVVKGAQKNSGGLKEKLQSAFSGLGKLFGLSADDVDLSYWNISDPAKSAILNDNDTKSAVDAAANLKSDLEAQRADLTPVFDLDQLAADANKANGIVMSSLMAAQNASIADYINKDSELNPFAKDRWQNVYNFTQNNYSPKALSRIDIYRQTQRQLSMSRGF